MAPHTDHTAFRFVAVLLTMAAALTAQDDPETGRIFGLAKHADGSAWVGARVQLRETTEFDVWLDVADMHSATTDERGRFHADVPHGRTYAMWTEERLADGTILVSTTTERAIAGDRVEMTANAQSTKPPVLELSALPADAVRPLRVSVRHEATGLIEEHAVRELHDGATSLMLAAQPPASRDVVVSTADGQLVLVARMPSTQPLTLSPQVPNWRRIHVEERDTKKAIAEARIDAFIGGRCHPLGTTDAQGVAAIHVSAIGARSGGRRAALPRVTLSIRSKGFQPDSIANGHGGGHPTQEAALAAAHPDVTCNPSKRRNEALMIRLRIGEWPLARARFTSRLDLFLTGDDGTLDVGELERSNDRGTTVGLILDPDVLARLPPTWRDRAPTIVPLVIGAGEERVAKDGMDELDLLRALRPVDLQLFLADDHSPAVSMELAVGLTGYYGRVRTDRRGRLRIFVPVGTKRPFVVAGFNDLGWCAVGINPGIPDGDPTRVAGLDVRLERSLPVRIKFGAGELERLPSKLQVELWIENSQGVPGAQRSWSPQFAGPKVHYVQLPGHQVQSALNRVRPSRKFAGSTFEYGIPKVPGTLMVSASGQLDGRPVRANGKYTITGDEPILELELAFCH